MMDKSRRHLRHTQPPLGRSHMPGIFFKNDLVGCSLWLLKLTDKSQQLFGIQQRMIERNEEC
jgi:hypothetical protein